MMQTRLSEVVWNEFSKVLKNRISKDEFNFAKKKLQVNLQMTSEQSSDVFSKMLSQPDISDRATDIQTIVGQLEQGDYSNESLNQFAKKILSGKQPTLVSVGNLKTMPYIDDLKA